MNRDNREENFYRAVTCLLLGIEFIPNLKNIKYRPMPKNIRKYYSSERVNFFGNKSINYSLMDFNPYIKPKELKPSMRTNNINLPHINKYRKNKKE